MAEPSDDPRRAFEALQPSDDPRRALDELQPIDSGALMAEVREEVERRRAAGHYPASLDDVPPFGDLGLEDDMVASVHRIATLARIPGVTPVVHEMVAGPAGGPEGFVRPSRKAQLVNQTLIKGRAVARRVVGPRLEGIIRQGADYLTASASHARIVAGRILDLERRVRALEERGPAKPS